MRQKTREVWVMGLEGRPDRSSSPREFLLYDFPETNQHRSFALELRRALFRVDGRRTLAVGSMCRCMKPADR